MDMYIDLQNQQTADTGTLWVKVPCFDLAQPVGRASWSSGNTFVSGAGGLSYKFQTGQIGHRVANGLPLLRHSFERSCVSRAQ